MARDQNVDINASIHSIFIAGTPRVFPILEMPATDSAAIVVARFLRANHYNEVSIVPLALHSWVLTDDMTDSQSVPGRIRFARGGGNHQKGRLDDRKDPRREAAV